ncbi:unnamed protein product [Urochloa decumbens]|uniref:DUF1618 domain-containing protein n=1 Tax=Urochloa decumbens TaxID=240449 RepID=A0ABC9FCK7_9POAL
MEWCVFDRRLMHIHGGGAVCSSTAAGAETTTGQSVIVSLRLVPPPLTSYMEIHTDSSLSFYGQASILAAHGDLALIYGVVVVKGARPGDYPGNFLLYKASPACPSLRLLTSPGKPWRGRAKFTGVLHLNGGGGGDGDDFVVAHLQGLVGAEGEEVAELFRYSSGSGEWELLRIDMPGDADRGFYPLSWYTDTVFSDGSFMYWADYHQGLLSCDVSAEHPRLQFIKFPGIETKIDFDEGRGLPEILRTVSISRGRMWFVDVDDGRFRSRWSSLCSPSVTMWSREGTEWVQEHAMDLGELWSSAKYRQSCLPRTVPEFPVLDMEENGLVHFIVRESDDSTDHWIATIDMNTATLKSHRQYINQIETMHLGYNTANMFWDSALLSSQLCRCLNIPAGN